VVSKEQDKAHRAGRRRESENYLLGIYTITPIVAIQAHRESSIECDRDPILLEISRNDHHAVTLLSTGVSSGEENVGSRNDPRDPRADGMLLSPLISVSLAASRFSAPSRRQMFLSLFHNDHRGTHRILLEPLHIQRQRARISNAKSRDRHPRDSVLAENRQGRASRDQYLSGGERRFTQLTHTDRHHATSRCGDSAPKLAA